MNKQYLFALVLVCLLIPTIIAAEFPSHYDDYVNDFAEMFNAEQTSSLRFLLNEVRTNTTAEVVVVTATDCTLDFDKYAVDLATNWGIGKADKDNGLLILYCQNVNKLVVKTGYGLEGILPDSKIGRMLDNFYVPLRDEGKLNEGIILFTEETAKVLQENREEIISGQAAGSKSNFGTWIFFILAILIIISIISVIKKSKIKSETNNKLKTKNKKKYGIYLNFLSIGLIVVYFISGIFAILVIAVILMILLRIIGRNPSSPFFVPVSSGNGFSSGGGFGGGGFGGGGFGGGGASR